MKAVEDSASQETEGSFGVERTEDGFVSIQLGHIPPFEIHPQIAVKFAALLLKKAGAHVKITPVSLVALWKPEPKKPIEEEIKEFGRQKGHIN